MRVTIEPYRKPGSLDYFADVSQADGSARTVALDTANLAEARKRCAGLAIDADGAAAPSSAAQEAALVQAVKSARTGSVHWALQEHLKRKNPDIAEATRGMYTGQAGTLVRLLGERAISSLTYDDLSYYTALRKSEKVVYETIRKEMVLLRSSLRTAYYLGHQVPDLFMLFPKLAARYVPRRRWLAKDEFAALLEKLPPARGVYLCVACYTGARRSELARMTWQDIDWQRGIIQLRGTKTAAALRIVPLHDELRAILRPLACRPTSAVLEKWGNVCRDLGALCHQLGIPPVTPNDLRRTFGSWMVQGNVSSHTVAKLMGHTTEKMVNQVYGHLDDGALRRAVASLPSFPKPTT